MAITSSLHFSNLQFHFQASSSWNFNPQLSHSLSALSYKPKFQSLRTQFPKPLCLASNGNDSASRVAVLDPSLALKKKATDIAPGLKGTSIFLVGMHSSMKTSLGKLLADALRYYYFDSDSLVEEAAGGEFGAKSFRESDEEGFRVSETEVLKQLSSMGRLVVCAGDGAVQSSTNLALLRHGITIWIDVPLDMVAKREINNRSQQPVTDSLSDSEDDQVLTQLASLHQKMRGGYGTADATVSLQKIAYNLGYDDLNAVTTEDMTMEVLKEIEKLTRAKRMMEEAAKPF